jgi:hypothetical protein
MGRGLERHQPRCARGKSSGSIQRAEGVGTPQYQEEALEHTLTRNRRTR